MKFRLSIFVLIFSLVSVVASAQKMSSKDEKLMIDVKDALEQFKKSDGMLKNLFESAYGYAIFPSVGKGGLGVGGAFGNGAVYEKNQHIGMAKLSQVNIGFQAGGQSYRELIFFENAEVLNRFKENKIELSATASAVLATEGAAAAAKYKNGIMIFTQVKGGLMYEAAVGGQKFSFRKL